MKFRVIGSNSLGKGGVFRDATGRVMYFDPADFQNSFTHPAIGTLGNVPRNFMRGPHYWNCDLAVLKTFTVTEGKEIQFRGEFFDIFNFNHTNFGDPTTNLESGQFGQITTTRGDPRIMQFALKIYF